MAKFGAVTLCYNDEGTIAGTIKCLAPFVDKHVVLISEKPYFGETSKPDRSEEICLDLGCDVVKGFWELDHFQRNLGNQMCSDCDWVFTFDSDEMMQHGEIERMIRFTEKCPVNAIGVRPEIYWHDIDHVLVPKPEYEPIVMLKPSVKFWLIRNIDCSYLRSSVDMHHLSWAYPKDIYKKVTNYAHASDFDGAKWYKEHYVNWKEGDKAVMPFLTCDVIRKPLPQELRDYLK